MTTIVTTDWLMSGFIVVAAIGVFVGLQGLKTGWLLTLSAIAGAVLKSALSMMWVYWALGCLLVAGVVLVVVNLLIKKNVIQDLIKNIQSLKSVADTDRAKSILKNQTKETKKIVGTTKLSMKLKGRL